MPKPPDARPLTNRAAGGLATPDPRRRATRPPPLVPRERGKKSIPRSRAPSSLTARALALVALALGAAVIAGVVSAGGSSHSRQTQSVATELRTVTVTRPTRATTVNRPAQPPAARPAPPPRTQPLQTLTPRTTGTGVTFVPVDVRPFGFTTAIPARWRVRTQEYARRQRATLIGPAEQSVVIDRTARAPARRR